MTEGNKLSDREIAYLNAADPHAVVSTKPWELTITSRYLKRVALVWVVVVMAVHIFMAAVLDAEFTGLTITTIDKFAFPGVGIIISVLSWIALTRPRVRANEDGVEVRNIIGTRFYPWLVVYGLSFPRGARMARLELPEFEYVPLWAIQSGDKERAIAAVDAFRRLEAAYMPED
ncbi:MULTISPECIES: PH domain-containing protein [unclassified Corynebacterium]|uniref:PH domain-containing protein n=1 Tax=unclassified Corynebacterium TaxID=2624378 RepID=UPI002A91DBD3|nr:PH domain-containing protein [Corynebacterium sp.]MDY5786179.1 PH domain-containing protein [Corynebacterium sp.]